MRSASRAASRIPGRMPPPRHLPDDSPRGTRPCTRRGGRVPPGPLEASGSSSVSDRRTRARAKPSARAWWVRQKTAAPEPYPSTRWYSHRGWRGIERRGHVLLHVALQGGVAAVSVASGERRPVQVPVEVEVVVIDPVRPAEAVTCWFDLLPEDRVGLHEAGLEQARDLVPVRHLPEQQHRHDDHEVVRPVHGQPDGVQRGDGSAVRHGHGGLLHRCSWSQRRHPLRAGSIPRTAPDRSRRTLW